MRSATEKANYDSFITAMYRDFGRRGVPLQGRARNPIADDLDGEQWDPTDLRGFHITFFLDRMEMLTPFGTKEEFQVLVVHRLALTPN
jgi:hypothetical protein